MQLWCERYRVPESDGRAVGDRTPHATLARQQLQHLCLVTENRLAVQTCHHLPLSPAHHHNTGTTPTPVGVAGESNGRHWAAESKPADSPWALERAFHLAPRVLVPTDRDQLPSGRAQQYLQAQPMPCCRDAVDGSREEGTLVVSKLELWAQVKDVQAASLASCPDLSLSNNGHAEDAG